MWNKRNLAKKLASQHNLSIKESEEIVDSVLTEVQRTVYYGGRIPGVLSSKGIKKRKQVNWLKCSRKLLGEQEWKK